MPVLVSVYRFVSSNLDFFNIGDAGTTEFLDDQGHVLLDGVAVFGTY